MIHRFLVTLFGLVLAASVTAQEARNLQIEDTIQRQIDAFQNDDFAQAFEYVTPNIQNHFGNSDNFGAMVRQGFPMVWRPSEFRFLELDPKLGSSLQNVMIRDQAGEYYVLEYEMIQTARGWQINGVRFVEPPAIGV